MTWTTEQSKPKNCSYHTLDKDIKHRINLAAIVKPYVSKPEARSQSRIIISWLRYIKHITLLWHTYSGHNAQTCSAKRVHI